ncbi:4a-hydroxytetrahydrobiopterin dehydratase [Candidatus Uhrbacteria bacterium]|nr:4a-hydroxytetrahydrobiopterin dehydratase [Candidatus Uhrbacteria bacterium]
MSYGELYGFLKNVKEGILIFCIIYFFGLAFTLQNGKTTYHADHPYIFLIVFGLFLNAILLDVFLEWRQKSKAILWAVIFIMSYGVIGFYIVPQIFGTRMMIYALLEPLIIIFFGGLIYSYAKVFTSTIFFSTRLTKQEYENTLKNLPGWNIGNYLEKTFQFEDFYQALNFVNRSAQKISGKSITPGFLIHYKNVVVRFRPDPLRGFSRKQLELAEHIEHLA